MSAQMLQFVIYVDEQGYYIGDAGRVAQFVDRPVEDVIHEAAWLTFSQPDQIVLFRSSSVRGVYKGLRLLAELHQKAGRQRPIDQTIHLIMPCGHGARYIAFDDIPWKSTPCPCGNPSHWLISYSDEWDVD